MRFTQAPYRSVIEHTKTRRERAHPAGLELPDEVEITVWDSTSEARYMVLPVRPAGTEALGAGELTALNNVPVVDKVYTMIGLLASLNIALFVFNLIPLLPLDGGHIAGALWEGIRRSWAKLFMARRGSLSSWAVTPAKSSKASLERASSWARFSDSIVLSATRCSRV